MQSKHSTKSATLLPHKLQLNICSREIQNFPLWQLKTNYVNTEVKCTYKTIINLIALRQVGKHLIHNKNRSINWLIIVQYQCTITGKWTEKVYNERIEAVIWIHCLDAINKMREYSAYRAHIIILGYIRTWCRMIQKTESIGRRC